MPHPPQAIANRFLEVARSQKQSVDPMKVQKLVYFAHGWHLGYGEGALSSEPAQAWMWGPVFPELYRAVKSWGMRAITEKVAAAEYKRGRFRWHTPDISASDIFARSLVERVWEVYGGMSGMALSQLSHEPDGPWDRVWHSNPGQPNLEIPDSLIRDHFAAKLRANGQA